MKNALNAFAFNTRKSLKLRKLRQNEAAERLGISLTYMSQLVRAEKTPSFEMIVKISELLDVSIGELFGPVSRRPSLDRLIYIASALSDELIESLCTVAETLSRTNKKESGAQS